MGEATIMARPAQALRQQAQSIWPGATVAERGKRYIKHQHPTQPERYMLDASIGPIHYGPGANQEIDTTWQPSTGAWQYEMVQDDYNVHARDVFNAGSLIEYRDPYTDEWVIFDPQSLNWINQDTSRQQIAIKQTVNAQVTDDVLEFPAGWGAGRHFRYQCQPGRLQKVITIDAPGNLPAPTVQGNSVWLEAEFSISTSTGVELYLDGSLWQKVNGVRVQTANRIEFRDTATGSQVFWYLDFPRAWDSAGRSTVGEFEVRRQGGPTSLFITVRIPKTWVDAATFPVYIDPTIDTQVAANLDDAIEATDGNGAEYASDDRYSLKLPGGSGDYKWTAARFTSISIDAGATIDTSYLSYKTAGFGVVDMDSLIHGQDVASPGNFTFGTYIYNRTKTTANVAWSATLTDDAFNNSPSINSIVQELVDSYSYSSGAMCFILEAQSSTNGVYLTGYTNASTDAAKLHIEYSGGGGTPASLVPPNILRRMQHLLVR